MFTKQIDKIARAIAPYGSSDTDMELYIYSLNYLLSFLFTNSIILLISYFLGNFTITVIWLICYVSLRSQIGGYHAKSTFTCTLLSILFCVLAPYCYKLLALYPYFSFIIIAICFGTVLLICPVEHANHPLNQAQKATSQKHALILLFAGSVLELFLYPFQPNISYSIISGHFFAVILCIIGYINYNND